MVCNLDLSETTNPYKYISLEKNLASIASVRGAKNIDEVLFKPKGFDHIIDYFQHRLFLFLNHNRELCYALSDKYLKFEEDNTQIILPSRIKELFSSNGESEIKEIYFIRDEEFNEVMEKVFVSLNTMNAKYRLDLLSPAACAKNVNYVKIISYIFLFFICFLIVSPVLFILINNLVYFSHILFRIVILFSSGLSNDCLNIRQQRDIDLPEDKDLPVYTILIPLYQEFYKLNSIIRAMDAMDYPKDKMDVKLIIEEDDELTLKALKVINLENYVHVVKVPFSFPRTKPKALNYAMSYARGEYVVIYDAEDVPEIDQLRKALAVFRELPQEYVCLQAKLNFYNSKDNLLTKFFSVEYGLLFNYLLKGLSARGMPVPLGGTSNHFKIFALNEIGRWDAYNVTEDADMGIRLSMRNYKTYVFDSTTYEESPISLGNWMHQRSRWIKGFIQTSIIFLNDKSKRRNLSFTHCLSVYIFLCLTPYGFFCVPWMFVAGYFASGSYIMDLTLVNSFISMVYLYSTAFFVMRSMQIKVRTAGFCIAFFLWPFYFCLHVVASYISIFQSITNPFKWNKTKHGESAGEKDLDI